MAVAIERRRSCRTTPASRGTEVVIMDVDEKWMMPAKVLDISADGGLISPGIVITIGRRICMLFEKIPEAGWLDAVVVRAPRPCQIGIMFQAPLNAGLLQAVTSEGEVRRAFDPLAETPSLGDVVPGW